MKLSNDLLSQFVKITKTEEKPKGDTTLYGTAEIDESGNVSVRFDGADISTPATTTVSVQDGDRVTAIIKNHSVIVTGNKSAPAAVKQRLPSSGKLLFAGTLIGETASLEMLQAERARIDKLYADDVTIRGRLDTNEGKIKNLEAEDVTIKGRLTSTEGNITDLQTKKLDAESAKLIYANIDFSNIGKAAMEHFYAQSGLIKDVIVEDGTITGHLIGVTISGDRIEGNTVVAEKLVIKGEDGLYYKLNTDGVVTEAEQTAYNSLDGRVILAKSITATKISVDDLVAFDATIGGFTITEDSIYSEVKDSDGNTTRGIHLSADGQFNYGDDINFIRYYQDEDGSYKLAISADSILYALNGKYNSISDLGRIGEYVRIGTYEDEPCIELGEGDSDFKLIITNTRMMFMEGSSVLAYFNNQSLHIKKAVVEEELQQGGFVWKVRSNGNMGLVWKGGI